MKIIIIIIREKSNLKIPFTSEVCNIDTCCLIVGRERAFW